MEGVKQSNIASFCSEAVNTHANLCYKISKAGIIIWSKIIEQFTSRSWKCNSDCLLGSVNVD